MPRKYASLSIPHNLESLSPLTRCFLFFTQTQPGTEDHRFLELGSLNTSSNAPVKKTFVPAPKSKDKNRYRFDGAPHTRKLLCTSQTPPHRSRSIRNPSILAVRKKATLSMRLASSLYAGLYVCTISVADISGGPSYSGCRLGRYHAATILGTGRPVYLLLLLPCSGRPKIYLRSTDSMLCFGSSEACEDCGVLLSDLSPASDDM